MPNISSGLIVIVSNTKENVANFITLFGDDNPHRKFFYRSSIHVDEIITIGPGQWGATGTIECAWSVIGCLVERDFEEPLISLESACMLYNVGVKIEAEENDFAERLLCTNTGVLDYESVDLPDIDIEESETKLGSFYFRINGTIYRDANGNIVYFNNEDDPWDFIGDNGLREPIWD